MKRYIDARSGLLLLVLWVRFAQNVHAALSTGNVTVCTELLHSGSDFVRASGRNHLHDGGRCRCVGTSTMGSMKMAVCGCDTPVRALRHAVESQSEVVQHS